MSENWSCAADFLDDIEVDKNGNCKWTDVANAQTHIRVALRQIHSEEIAALQSQLASARKAFNEIFRYSNEKWIVDVALIARNQIALTDDMGDSK